MVICMYDKKLLRSSLKYEFQDLFKKFDIMWENAYCKEDETLGLNKNNVISALNIICKKSDKIKSLLKKEQKEIYNCSFEKFNQIKTAAKNLKNELLQNSDLPTDKLFNNIFKIINDVKELFILINQNFF